MRKIAITDIHGCHLTFRKLVDEVLRLELADELYLLGDYIDRGPGSKEVFDFIFELIEKGHTVNCLRGNHEEVLLQCIQDEGKLINWMRYGGKMTLASFGVNKPIEIDPKYLDFIRTTAYSFEVDNYILVHAGLNFVAENPLEDKEGLLWSRYWEGSLNKKWMNGRRLVYGHTPNKKSQIEYARNHLNDRLLMNIDGGCYDRNKEGLGNLAAFDMTNELVFFQENIDDMSAWEAHKRR